MKNDNLLFIIGVGLLAFGLLKPDLSKFPINFPLGNTNTITIANVEKPTDPVLLDLCDPVIEAIKSGGSSRSVDGNRLASLYSDLARLIELDGDMLIIKNTEEIREANRLSGNMLKLDIKGKYSNLASACNKLVVTSIGDENAVLSDELRRKGASAFKALAWACYEGAK